MLSVKTGICRPCCSRAAIGMTTGVSFASAATLGQVISCNSMSVSAHHRGHFRYRIVPGERLSQAFPMLHRPRHTIGPQEVHVWHLLAEELPDASLPALH